ncbi:MAG: hypothetical protein KQJ78_20545 [Deltaproteobacteria bacterium]|nr:hypothetical protein [Deltaproteobacteria bacterium]
MALDVTQLQMVRETEVFIAAESTFGTLAAFVAANAVLPVGLPTIKQMESFTPNPEIKNSRSLTDRFRDVTPPGEWQLDVLARPSGTAGTAPAEDTLLYCALGDKEVTGSTSVVYTPAIELPTFSMGVRVSDLTRFAAGCAVESLKIAMASKGAVAITASGKCKSVVMAGKSTTAADSTTTVLNLVEGGAMQFQAGARIKVGTDDNTGAGYEISAVDTTADTVTVSPALTGAPAADLTVEGFLPTGSVVGAPLENRYATLSLGGTALTCESFDLTIANQANWLDLISTGSFPEAFVLGQRTVSGSASLPLILPNLKHFRQARDQEEAALSIAINGGAGKTITLAMAQTYIDTPEVSGDVQVNEQLTFNCLGSAGEDEISASYT